MEVVRQKNNGMRTIICVWGDAGIGKSSVIKRVFDKLNVPTLNPVKELGDDIVRLICNLLNI